MINIVSFFQEIFMLKQDNSFKIGLTDLRQPDTLEQDTSKKSHAPKELRLSELMRKGNY